VALITDGRFSGRQPWLCGGHLSPEAAAAAAALVRTGDGITIDAIPAKSRWHVAGRTEARRQSGRAQTLCAARLGQIFQESAALLGAVTDLE